MADVAVAVLAATPAEYTDRLKTIKSFAQRVHIDLTDGDFAPSQTIGLAQAYLPEGVSSDLHLMLKHPDQQLETIISLGPDLVIAHFEAEAELAPFFTKLKAAGIKTGLALLPESTVAAAARLIIEIDHLLVFTGKLGYHHGDFKAENLSKIGEAKRINRQLEVSVDGGINEQTAGQAMAAGADVLVSGGFIYDAANPSAAYKQLAVIK